MTIPITDRMDRIKQLSEMMDLLKEKRDKVQQRIDEVRKLITAEIQEDPNTEFEKLYWDPQVNLRELSEISGIPKNRIGKYVRPKRHQFICKRCGDDVVIRAKNRSDWKRESHSYCLRCYRLLYRDDSIT